MITNFLSGMWAAVAPGLGDHLWQSTLFACVAGLLTLTLRGNQARTRYWLWLAASVKFLIPFSFLMDLGSQLAMSSDTVGKKAGLYVVMEKVSQPFTPAETVGLATPAVHPTTFSSSLQAFSSSLHLLPMLLAAVWLCGFVVVLAVWCVQCHRLSAAARAAVPLLEGREVEALRRMERVGRVRRGIPLLSSRDSLEPGVFGIFRPVLLWPEGVSRHLDDAQLEAVMAHEMWHVRRRDHLTGALHMVVEAIFWFHPLVWWMEGRLVEERERACDEQVLLLCGKPQVYAESILKVCEFCVESPLTCVAGITGADLKRRIVQIMTERVGRKLDSPRKCLLVMAAVMAVAMPMVFGQVIATYSEPAPPEWMMSPPPPAPPPPPPPPPLRAPLPPPR